MSAEPAILTRSGFERRTPSKETVASDVKRLQQGHARFVTISAVYGTTASLEFTESEDTHDEPWARHIGIASHPRVGNSVLAQQNQSHQVLRRFWESVSEHTQGSSTPNIRVSTFAETSPRREAKDETPEQQVPPIWEIAAEIAAQISDEDWAKVPRDLAKNVDHYLYGAPKKEDA